jgi:hypothetical protein
MKKCLTVSLILYNSLAFAQKDTPSPCKIDFYFFRERTSKIDTSRKLENIYQVSYNDLEETAFIRSNEIISYSVIIDTIKNIHRGTFLITKHEIKVVDSVMQRVKSFSDKLYSGRKFALVINRQKFFFGHFLLRSLTSIDWVNVILCSNNIGVMSKLAGSNFVIECDGAGPTPSLSNCLTRQNIRGK